MESRTAVSQVLASSHLPGLDGLRAIAVGVVIAYHAGFAVPGDLGVTAFFVLSGFLITWLLLKEFDRTGDVSFRSFYLRRTFRIFPAYYAFVVFSMITDRFFDVPWTSMETAAGLGYFVNYYQAFRGAHDHEIAHAWSLGIEEQFYLLWPLLFLWAARRGIAAVRRTLLLAILAVVAWRSWLYLGMDVGSVYVYNAFDTRFDSLAIGCGLAACASHPLAERVSKALSAGSWLPILTVIALYYSRVRLPREYHYSVGFTVDAALCGILMIQILALRDSWTCRWLEHPVVRYLGRISYPLYLWHMVGLAAGRKVPLGPPWQLAAGLAACLLAAMGSWHFLEQPFLRLRHALETRRAASSGGPA